MVSQSNNFPGDLIMTMQIHVDPTDLTQAQREAVADFILSYPGAACAGACDKTQQATLRVDADLIIRPNDRNAPITVAHQVAGAAAAAASIAELATLQNDHESTMPAAAFGAPVVDEAAAAFGAPTAPLALSTPTTATAATVAPPPPVNTAPTTTTPGVASSVGNVELDAKGFPWDARIHAESKARNADNTWRRRRNLDAAMITTVEAELRQVMGAPTAPLAPSIAPIVPTPPPVMVAPVIANSPTVSESAAAVAPPAPPADARQQFVALVGRAAAALQAGKLTQAEVTQCCADVGIPALPLLANRLDLVATVAARIDAIIEARG